MHFKVIHLLPVLFFSAMHSAVADSFLKPKQKWRFKVEMVEGIVREQMPSSSVWRAIGRGTSLSEGTLIQIGTNSKVLIKIVKPERGETAQEILIEQPMILRLDPSLIRARHAREAQLRQAQADGDQHANLFGSLSAAWQQISSLTLTRAALTEVGNQAKPIERSTQVTTDLKIQSPLEGEVFKFENFPSLMRISFRIDPHSSKKAHSLRIQKNSGPAVETQIVGSADEAYVTIDGEGSYSAQLATADGKKVSSKYNFEVLGPLEQRLQRSGADQLLDVPLLRPDRGFSLFTSSQATFATEFCWELPKSFDPQSIRSVLNIEDSNRKIIRVKTTESCATAKLLPSGEYKWFVTVYSAAAANSSSTPIRKIGRSKSRRFALRSTMRPGADLELSLQEALDRQKSATLVIE